jgi:hypothetical protein
MSQPLTGRFNVRSFKALPVRVRIAAISVLAIVAIIVVNTVLPSNTLLTSTQRWTTASSSIIRSKFLRAKAKAPRPPIHHPIPKLMSDAREDFDKKLSRQSTTFPQAVTEYQKRYGRNPPKAFNEWFAFAKEYNAVLVDEYDQLYKDLEPFWSFSGEELRRRCVQVGVLPSVDLVRIENGSSRTIDVSKGFEDSEVGARAKGFQKLLAKFQHKLPNMDFPINEKAEGRILVPWEERIFSNLTVDSSRRFAFPKPSKYS